MTTASNPAVAKAGGKQQTVIACNFRSASRISNEDARALTTLHEGFARNVAAALGAFLGTAVEVKLGAFEQSHFAEQVAGLPPLSYIVPYSLRSPAGTMIVECDIELVFPMVDLLLGGSGDPFNGAREMSEIEEEIMAEVFSLIVRQAETAWQMGDGSLTAGKRALPAALDQCCAPNEKVTCLTFVVTLGEIAGSIRLVLPTVFLNLLMQQIHVSKPQKRPAVRYFPRQSVRERILDCDVEVAVELPGLKIAVKDLVGLLPGSVLKLRASVRTPGMLTAGGCGIFEATPVRTGSRKAAQLGRRIATTNLERI